jgi:hypothetical protein
MKKTKENHAFSVELNHKEHLKTVAIPSGTNDNVIIEGFLGILQELNFVEDSMLEIQGVNGTIRVDMDCEDIKKLFKTKAEKEVKQ